MQITAPLLITKYCDSEIVALKEQVERQNIEIQALKVFFKEQVSIIIELNDQLKYLKEENKNKTEIMKVLTENIDKHLPSYEEFVIISNRKKRN